MNEFDLGWLIGILDGEGYFGIKSHAEKGVPRYTPILTLSNTNQKIIKRFEGLLYSLGVAFSTHYRERKHPHKPIWSVSIQSQLAIASLLRRLLPLMECRKEQAETLKAFVDLRLSKQRGALPCAEEERLRERMSVLNKRGI